MVLIHRKHGRPKVFTCCEIMKQKAVMKSRHGSTPHYNVNQLFAGDIVLDDRPDITLGCFHGATS